MSQFLDLLGLARSHIQPPVALVLGAPRMAAQLVGALALPNTVCYQMDLYQAARLRSELAEAGAAAEVAAHADLWDLPAGFQTVLFPSPPRAERDLKIDLAEQAAQILLPGGTFLVLSPIEHDQLYPKLLKKIFGKSSVTATEEGTIIWAVKTREHARRRHEVVVQARVDEGESIRFTTRPGVFGYGQLDQGSRALLSAAEIRPGDRVLDLGCGAGGVGLAAARRSGPTGHVTFADSNLRATALVEENARTLALPSWDVIASADPSVLPANSFDVVLTNPPYYSQQTIARSFIEHSKRCLKPGGRLYLVTKQLDDVLPIVQEDFGEPEMFESRGYIILAASK